MMGQTGGILETPHKAKAYQVKQVLKAIERMEMEHGSEKN